jgi:hypothetical protein
MSAWAAGNFDNDTALNRVYTLVKRLIARIDKLLAKPPRRLDRLYDVSEQVMCDVELVVLIARHMFEPATFRWPIGGDMLPSATQVEAWKAELLAAWDVGVDPEDVAPGYLAQRRQAMCDGFDRLAELVRWQEANVEQVQRAYRERVLGGRAEQGNAADRPRD